MLSQIRGFSSRSAQRIAASIRSLSAHPVKPVHAETAPATTDASNEVAVDFNDKDIPGFREPGTIPTNYEIATGKERYEFMKNLKGEEPWDDMTPIKMAAKGTKEVPIQVSGVDPVFYVGCTGFPADTHEVLFLTLNPKRPFDRCPHCGNVFKYNQLTLEGAH